MQDICHIHTFALLIGNGWLEKFLLIASIWVLMLIEFSILLSNLQ